MSGWRGAGEEAVQVEGAGRAVEACGPGRRGIAMRDSSRLDSQPECDQPDRSGWEMAAEDG